MPNFTTGEWFALAIVAVIGIYGLWATVGYALITSRKRSKNGGSSHGWLRRLKRNPAAIGGLVGAAATLLAAFGFNLSSEQVGAISAFLVFIIGFIVRFFVTPVHDPKLPDDT